MTKGRAQTPLNSLITPAACHPDLTYHLLESSEHIGDNIKAENLALQVEVNGLREMVDLYLERLTDADWRYQELFEQLKTMTNALPAPQGTGPRPKRWWWPFR